MTEKSGGYRPKFGYDIRVRPPGKQRREKGPVCAHADCNRPGEFKAPKNKGNLREYQWLCLDHIREFNKTWNFFDGMDEETAAAERERMMNGDRPTWKLGSNPWTHGKTAEQDKAPKGFAGEGWRDPYDLLDDGPSTRQSRSRTPVRKVPERLQRSFATMNLSPPSSPDEIKLRYKELVKRFHPDANQGEKGYEERLKEIIEAYQNLKSAGFC